MNVWGVKLPSGKGRVAKRKCFAARFFDLDAGRKMRFQLN
jgi:hypothetical protein